MTRLIDDLVDALEPAPVRPALAVFGAPLALASLLPLAVVAFVYGLRPDMGTAMAGPVFWVKLAVPGIVAAGAGIALARFHPRARLDQLGLQGCDLVSQRIGFGGARFADGAGFARGLLHRLDLVRIRRGLEKEQGGDEAQHEEYSVPMIGRSGQKGCGAVKLFCQHDAYQLVRPDHATKGKLAHL